MRELWDKLIDKATDASEFVESVTQGGIRFLQSTVGKLPLFTSTTADDCDRRLEIDETHYLLVPFRADPCGYALYTTRSLPPGVGPTNSLPKARVFHLHDRSGLEALEGLLVESGKRRVLTERAGAPDKPDLADHLDSLGEQIDRESFKVTGGLLIIGGAVALMNPIMGAGIAAKAIFPSLGAKASKLSLKFAGQKLRDRNQKKENRRAEKEAKAELKKLKPELYLNPLLVRLDEAVATAETDHDPLLANPDLVQAFPNTRYLRVSIQAILTVYEKSLQSKVPPAALHLHGADLAWFAHLRELRDTLQES
jgi:hypothetical protein